MEESKVYILSVAELIDILVQLSAPKLYEENKDLRKQVKNLQDITKALSRELVQNRISIPPVN